MERKRLMFEGKSIYVYSFYNYECSHDLWTTQEVDLEVLNSALIEINEICRKQAASWHETIWDNEKDVEISNPEYDPEHDKKPHIYWVDLLREKFGMNDFSVDVKAREPQGWTDYEYKPNVEKVKPGDYRY